jgi:Xaa-Pro dipeptidase
MNLRIDLAELRERRARAIRAAIDRGTAGLVFFSSTSIFYLTGFSFIPTERPAALVMTGDGATALFVPRLEHEHAEEQADVDEVRSYPEYPGERHPLLHLADLLREKGLAGGTLAADAPGYGSAWGYEGPKLEEVLEGTKILLVAKLIENHRVVKSPREIALIRESARWGNLAHSLLQEYSVAGRTETEIAARASREATEAMIRTLGPSFEPRGGGAGAGFRGQIGANSAHPHAITKNLRLKTGDVLVTGAGASVWGYDSELERTMFVGRPSEDQERFFGHMLEMQDVAFAAIKPGRPCAVVDEAVREVFERRGLWAHWRHHVGHALGILGHEAPFFDLGDKTIIEPGMVFSVEPGIYVPGLGGFRHSDTLVVTGDGIELLTYYPRDLPSLICGG